MKQAFSKILELIEKHPGLDAIALKGKGFRPGPHGSLRDAERAGLILFINGGWYLNLLGELEVKQ